MSILNELEELVRSAESTRAREQQMLDMFKLAGYEMDIEPDEEGKSCPKTLLELLKEALGNPPEDAGSWIRIADIPRFISEHLQVPGDLQAFNDSRLTSKPQNVAVVDDTPEPVLSGITEQSETTNGVWYVDPVGAKWKRESEDRWTLEGDDEDIGGYRFVDVTNMGPINKTSAGVSNNKRVARL